MGSSLIGLIPYVYCTCTILVYPKPSAHAVVCLVRVCPRHELRYEAQIGLKAMEEQAVRAAAIPENMAKLALGALQ